MPLTLLGTLTRSGGFNAGIEVWQENPPHGRLFIRKIFRQRDLPWHARREADLCDQLAACPFIVHTYSDSITTTAGSLLMEYCSKGTVGDLIREHRNRRRKIPESFVWHVFYSLVEAVHYMQYGPRGDARGWNWAYHRDIHPGNIFITGNINTGLRVLLGDFGSAVSSVWSDGGRVRMQAGNFGVPERYITNTSDVYQIGLDIVAMCRLTSRPLQFARLNWGGRGYWVAGKGYSEALNGLVGRCLRNDPKDRIGVRDLRTVVYRECVEGRASSHDRRGLLVFPTITIYKR